MANNVIKRTWKQGKMVTIEDLSGMTFQQESSGHTFVISGVDENGGSVALSGTPSGVLLRTDDQEVALTCSVSDGKVYATIPANGYAVPGRFGITVFLTSGGQTTAIFAAVGTVVRTSSGVIAPPAGSDVVTLINQINAAIAAIPVNYNAAIAPAYSESGLYAVGQYVTQGGVLYRCITPVTTAGSWSSNQSKFTAANLGTDLSDLKSAIMRNIPADWLESGNIGSTGADASGNDRIRSCFMHINGSTTISCEGSAYSIVVYLYNDSFEYDDIIEPFAQKASFSYNGYARIKVKNNNTPSGNISSEINTVAQSVYISQTVTEGKWCLTTGGIVSGGVTASGVFTNANDRARTMLLQVNGKSIFSLPNTSVYEMVAFSYYNDFSFHEQFVTSWSKEVRANFTGYVVLMFRNSTTPSGNISGEIETIRSSLKCNFKEFVYPVAKELDNLKKEYNTSKEDYNACKEDNFIVPVVLPDGTFESGNITPQGTESPDLSRIRSMFIPANNGVTIKLPSSLAYQFVVYAYDPDFNFTSQTVTNWTQETTANFNGYIRLKFRKSTSPDSDISGEINTLRQALTCKFSDYSYLVANKLFDYMVENDQSMATFISNWANNEIIGERMCVSDTSKTCASAAEVVMDETTGHAYVVYLSSKTKYGEQKDLVMLSRFSIANPNVAEHFIVAENGTTVDGVAMTDPYEPNILKAGNTLKISFRSGTQYYIREFDIATQQLSNTLTKMKISYGGNTYDMNDSNINSYYTANSATFGSYAIFTCRHVVYNNAYYSAISSDYDGCNSVLCSSSDGITWSLLGIMPGTARYEEQIAFVDGTLYALGRGDNKIYSSTDAGTTWLEYMTVASFSQRPQLMEYKGNLLSIIPVQSNVSDYIGVYGRNIVDIYLNQTKKLRISSKYSIVYPALFTVYNDIYIVYSNGQVFGSKYEDTGKDALFVSRIGEMFTDKNFEYRV